MGDIVQVEKDSFFPADLLLLAVPESIEGIAYVETINLDGESNLKIKKALDETQDLKADTLSDFTVSLLDSQSLPLSCLLQSVVALLITDEVSAEIQRATVCIIGIGRIRMCFFGLSLPLCWMQVSGHQLP